MFPGMEQQFESFPKEIDDEANSYFQKIYNKTMSIPAVLDMLKRFQDSSVKKERYYFLKNRNSFLHSILYKRKGLKKIIVQSRL